MKKNKKKVVIFTTFAIILALVLFINLNSEQNELDVKTEENEVNNKELLKDNEINDYIEETEQTETKKVTNVNLKDLTVKGYNINFKQDTRYYDIIVRNSNKTANEIAKSLEVTAVPEDENALISTKIKNLSDIENKIIISVYDENKTNYKEYILQIVRPLNSYDSSYSNFVARAGQNNDFSKMFIFYEFQDSNGNSLDQVEDKIYSIVKSYDIEISIMSYDKDTLEPSERVLKTYKNIIPVGIDAYNSGMAYSVLDKEYKLISADEIRSLINEDEYFQQDCADLRVTITAHTYNQGTLVSKTSLTLNR